MIPLVAAIPGWYQRLGLIAITIIILFLLAAGCWRLWYAWNLRAIRRRTNGFELAGSTRAPDLPCGFGYKTAWLAIRSDDIDAVRSALGFEHCVYPHDWADGLREAYEACENYSEWVYLTPPVDGWVFVVGWWAWPKDPNDLLNRLQPLSKTFGKALAFASHRVSSAYGWAKAVDGNIVRWFDLGDGEVSMNDGELTPIERRLAVHWDDPEQFVVDVDENCVLQVAGGWSVDPRTLDDRDEPRAQGLLCRVGK